MVQKVNNLVKNGNGYHGYNISIKMGHNYFRTKIAPYIISSDVCHICIWDVLQINVFVNENS